MVNKYLLLLLTILVAFPTVMAADPGHTASSVGPGTFENGNYVFPDNVTVNDRLGIGTITPSVALEVNGSVLQKWNAGLVTEIGSLQDATNLNGVFRMDVKNDIAFIAVTTGNKLAAVSIAEDNPVLISTVSITDPTDVEVHGQYAYVVAGYTDGGPESGLYIFNISDPGNIVLVGNITDDDYGGTGSALNGSYSLKVVGQYAYVTTWVDDSFTVIDVSDPTNPVEVAYLQDDSQGGTVSSLNVAIDVDVQGRFAYVTSSGDNTLNLIDISDPTNPYLFNSIKDTSSGGTAANLDWTHGVEVHNGYAYVSSQMQGYFTVINVTDPSNLKQVGAYDAGAQSFMLRVFYPYAIIFNGAATIVDVSDPTNPSTIQVLNDGDESTLLNGPADAFIHNNKLYITAAYDDALVVFSLPSLQTPAAQIGTLTNNKILSDKIRADEITIDNSLTVGESGIMSQGPVAIASSSPVDLLVRGNANITSVLYTPQVCLNGDCQTSWPSSSLWNNVSGNATYTAGRVGINTTSPTHTLHVAGTVNISSILYTPQVCLNGDCRTTWPVNTTEEMQDAVLSVGFAAEGIIFTYNDAGDNFTIGFDCSQVTDTSNDGISCSGENLVVTAGTGLIASATGLSVADNYLLNTGDTATGNYTFDSGLLHIDSTNDRIGIGTTTPRAKFHVNNGSVLVDASSVPTLINSVAKATPSYSRTIKASGDFIYLIDSQIWVYSIGVNPTSPVLSGNMTLPGSWGADIRNGFLYLATSTNKSLRIYDVRNPASISQVSQVNTSGELTSISLYGKYAYVGDDTYHELLVFDVSNVSNPVLINNISIGKSPLSSVIKDNYLYIGQYSSDISVWDLSDPVNPVNVANITASKWIYDLEAHNNILYASGFSGGPGSGAVFTINISDPTNPNVLDQVNTGKFNRFMTVAGRYLYTGSWTDKTLLVYDVSDANNITYVGTSATESENLEDPLVIGKYLYVSGSNNLLVYDIGGSDISTLSAGSLATDNLDVSGNTRITGDAEVSGGISVGKAGVYSEGELFTKDSVTAAKNIATPQVCLNGDCRTAWPSGLSGSGSAGYVPLWQNNTYLNSSSGIYVNQSRIGINTTTPQHTLDVRGTLNVTTSRGSGIYVDESGNVVIIVG